MDAEFLCSTLVKLSLEIIFNVGVKYFSIVCQGDWDFRAVTLDDFYRAFVLCFQMVVDEVENQSRGVVLVLDFKGFNLEQVKQFTPSFVKKLADLIQVIFSTT